LPAPPPSCKLPYPHASPPAAPPETDYPQIQRYPLLPTCKCCPFPPTQVRRKQVDGHGPANI
jgi:hypothetical protein